MPRAARAHPADRLLRAVDDRVEVELELPGDRDPVLPPQVGEAFAGAVGWPAPRPVPDASHFLQEDRGALIGEWIADWLRSGA